MSNTLMTPEFRVSYPVVFKPRRANEAAEPKYSISMLFAKDSDLSTLKAAVKDAAKERWGDKVPNNVKLPFLDQGTFDYEGYETGAPLIRANSKLKPGLVNSKVEQIIDESEFYPGCYARATVRAFAYDVSGNRGISFGLHNLQKLRDGEPLGGRTKPENDFAPVGDGEVGKNSVDALFQ